MKIHFKTLYVTCRKSVEEIDLSHHVTFFHGKVSSGKSTIARLIDFCLGGKLENTPAINKEFINSQLYLIIGKYNVILERSKDADNVIVSWFDEVNEEHFRINTPISPVPQPIFKDSIYCLSDLLLYLWDMSVLKVTTNNSSDSMLHRLSTRNFFWYCYLKQEKMDSSFFRFDEPFHLRTTKQTIRFILGYVNQRLVELEAELAKLRETKNSKKGTILELTQFLNKFSITVDDIEDELKNIKTELKRIEYERDQILTNYRSDTHASDKKRLKIIKLGESIANNESIAIDLASKISRLDSLKLELVSSLYKINRTISSNRIFSNQVYYTCPCCGESIGDEDKNVCLLCKQPKRVTENSYEVFELAKKDSESRIKDIDNSIDDYNKQLNRVRKTINKLVQDKITLDALLSDELRTYESSYMSQVREYDRSIASLRERIRNLLRTKALPNEINSLQDVLDQIENREAYITESIQNETHKIRQADVFVKELEEVFANTLKTVGVPGVMDNDTIRIDTRNWSVKIIPNDNSDIEWGFFEAGSGGKKTLINVCFLLSIHIVAEKNMLELPSFMIIDTPMKNIDKEVNSDLFENFYKYLFEVAETLLKQTQIIIIDNAVVAPNNPKLDFKDRYMTPDDKNHPPLISYYFGS